MQTNILREELLAKTGSTMFLPTFGTILHELLRIINDPDASLAQLLDIVKRDFAISAKIIRIANSACYRRGSMITDLKKAMMRIGFDEIAEIIVCMAFLKELLNQWRLSRADLEALWVHSLAVSNAVKILNRGGAVHPGKVSTVSILHDIGKSILYTYGERYRALIQKARRERTDICDLEKENFGIDHQEIGYLLSAKWEMPEEISLAVKNHHERAETDGPIRLVYVADAFLDERAVDLGEEGAILEREKPWITAETERMSELIGRA